MSGKNTLLHSFSAAYVETRGQVLDLNMGREGAGLEGDEGGVEVEDSEETAPHVVVGVEDVFWLDLSICSFLLSILYPPQV